MSDTVQVIKIGYIDAEAPFYFETARSAADYLEEVLDIKLHEAQHFPCLGGDIEVTVEIVEMKREEFERLPEL